MRIIIITLCFIVADILTGILKALATTGLDSSKLRVGAIHKGAEIMAIGLSYLCQHAPELLETTVYIPLLAPVCLYLIVMEIVSCIENLCVANPALAKVFGKYLEKLKEVDENGPNLPPSK